MRCKLPNLIIAGVNKAGTTSVFTYLSRHSDICPSSVKETCYFLPLRYGNELKPIGQYEQYFRHCDDQRYIIEATPGYYYGGRIIANAIYKQLGLIRIILILRNPVDRLFSFYKYLKGITSLPKAMTFEHYIQKCEEAYEESSISGVYGNYNPFDGIREGRYYNYINDWYNIFDEKLKVVFFEQLKADPRLFMFELCSWLDIDQKIYSSDTLHIENKSRLYKYASFHRLAIHINQKFETYLRRHPSYKRYMRKLYYMINEDSQGESISADSRAYLESLYRNDNDSLYKILHSRGYTQFPAWLKNDKQE